MIERDEYIAMLIETLQDDLFVMDREEIYDVLEFILDVMFKGDEVEEGL
jgi:hypothetical protein